MAVYGVAGLALGAGNAAGVVVGAAIYAGWTYVNSRVMPVWDKLKNKPKLKIKKLGFML